MLVARKPQIAILAAMETRRMYFRRTTVGALVLGFTLIAAGAGCIPGSVSGESPDGGQTMTVKTALACSTTPSGCLCASRDDQPDDILACSESSVAVHAGEQGLCCGNADLCTCDAFACKSNSELGFCQCSASAMIAMDGPSVAVCPAAAGQKCCLSKDTRVCVCSAADCDSGTMGVSNCTVTAVATCGLQQPNPSSCK
jgi:hypothetical protein